MAILNINTSNSTFLQIRRNGNYYVDKTLFLKELLEMGLSQKMLFTRPRRFGKSVTLSMVKEFLDITRDSRPLFEGLKIMEETDLVERHMNRYPVIVLSLKDVHGKNMEIIEAKLRSQLYSAAEPFAPVLRSSPLLDEYGRKLFDEIYAQTISSPKLSTGLRFLSDCLYTHYQKPVVILIDEYDVPLSRAYGTDHYRETREMIESMLSSVCKENDRIQAVIMTGCLYSIKGSTYTGVNNIRPFTLMTKRFSQYIGFTEEEVEKILADAGMSEQLGAVRAWYDGYLFGNTHIYCPWDVLRFVEDMQDGEYEDLYNLTPKNYWVNTSGTMVDFLRGFLDKTPDAAAIFDLLLSGKSIEQKVNESLPYHELHLSGQNLWSALLEDGYLTVEKKNGKLTSGSFLRIPNQEIADVLMREIGNYFKEYSEKSDLTDFWLSLWEGDADKAAQILNDALELSFKNLSTGLEYPYQYFLLGAARDRGYDAEAEADAGYGRLDLRIEQPAFDRGMVIETKHVKKKEEIETAMREAKTQIPQMKYYRLLQARKVGLIRAYAAVFYKRECYLEEIGT